MIYFLAYQFFLTWKKERKKRKGKLNYPFLQTKLPCFHRKFISAQYDCVTWHSIKMVREDCFLCAFVGFYFIIWIPFCRNKCTELVKKPRRKYSNDTIFCGPRSCRVLILLEFYLSITKSILYSLNISHRCPPLRPCEIFVLMATPLHEYSFWFYMNYPHRNLMSCLLCSGDYIGR